MGYKSLDIKILDKCKSSSICKVKIKKKEREREIIIMKKIVFDGTKGIQLFGIDMKVKYLWRKF